VAINGTLVYTLTVDNIGSGDATNVEVKDTLPTGSTYVSALDSAPGTNAFSCTQAGGVVDCTGGFIPHASSGPRQIVVTVFAPGTPGTYTDQVIVNPSQTIPEGDYTNDTSNVSTTVANNGANQVYDLNVAPLAHGTGELPVTPADPAGVSAGLVVPGGNILYPFVVGNQGSADAFNVEFQDVLPTGTTFISAVDSAPGSGSFTCTQSGGVVDCTGGFVPGTGHWRSSGHWRDAYC
jgi:uncharacterized repeat protein (TIGR01451 family)